MHRDGWISTTDCKELLQEWLMEGLVRYLQLVKRVLRVIQRDLWLMEGCGVVRVIRRNLGFLEGSRVVIRRMIRVIERGDWLTEGVL